MYYFDNEYLRDYLDLGSELKVYTNGQWYTVADASDIADPNYGIAYDIHGKSIRFNYKELEQIEASGKQMTIDQLQDILSGENTGEDSGDAKSDEGDGFGPDSGGPGNEPELPPDNGEPEELGVEDEIKADPTKKESVIARNAFNKMLNESISSKKTQYIGKFVKNIDEQCGYKGTTGVVKEQVGESVQYTIYSSPFPSDIGKSIYKHIDCIEVL